MLSPGIPKPFKRNQICVFDSHLKITPCRRCSKYNVTHYRETPLTLFWIQHSEAF
jgi:hypothetical protein